MNILLINGHPSKESFCHALARAYTIGIAQKKWKGLLKAKV